MDSYRFFTGRIARLNYFLSSFTTGIFAWVLIVLLALVFGRIVGFVVLLLAYIAVIFLNFSLIIRRCHDLGWNGWWSLLTLVPLANIVFGLMILFKRGEQAPNAYGPVPSTEVDILATLFPRGPGAAPAPSAGVPPEASVH